MPDSWSAEEVEATVADYFDMLDKEIRGVTYNKSQHRRALITRLDNRSDGAIERKHQNISAILIELGFVYISGYKPLSNYQEALKVSVSRRMEFSKELETSVRNQVLSEAKVPEIDDILSVLTTPPKPSAENSPRIARDRTNAVGHTNYLELEERNSSLGRAGEEFVFRFEIARLLSEGRDTLAKDVEHVAESRGDGLGYDVLSFNRDGSERLIEVKTTAYGAYTPFFVTSNELAVSSDHMRNYHVYRPYNFRRDPRMYIRSGSIGNSFRLQPSQYQAFIL
ncbi:MAG: DUF3883 domain-containing protein [bacterium]